MCLYIFVNSMLTQLLCSFLSSLHNTAEYSLSRELSVSSAQGSTRLLSKPKFHYRAHKSPPLDPSSARWPQSPKTRILVSVRPIVT